MGNDLICRWPSKSEIMTFLFRFFSPQPLFPSFQNNYFLSACQVYTNLKIIKLNKNFQVLKFMLLKCINITLQGQEKYFVCIIHISWKILVGFLLKVHFQMSFAPLCSYFILRKLGGANKIYRMYEDILKTNEYTVFR